MNTVVLKRGVTQIAENLTVTKPLILGTIAVMILYGDAGLRDLVIGSLNDAYLQVSIFVAGTLLTLMLIEKVGRVNISVLLRKGGRWQVPAAALLGMLPGCGGAIVVTTNYIRGNLRFGGVVAVLTATMGDAAFLLLAKEPLTAAYVLATCLVVGIVSGYVVDWLHSPDFLRVDADDADLEEEYIEENPLLGPLYKIWMALFIPGAVFGLLTAFQYDLPGESVRLVGQDWVTPFAVVAVLLSVVMWTLSPLSDIRLCISRRRPLSMRVIDTTNFVTFWVICAYVSYEVVVYAFDVDLAALFETWKYLVPLVALLVGFVPGCGPQIVVTALYLNGALPFSALIANAISNDGDALFPAIVVAPKASIIATLYSAVPAFLVGYGYFALFEL